MKYIVTGCAGHISAALIEKLLKADHKVTVIGRTPGSLQPLTSLEIKSHRLNNKRRDFIF